MFFLCLKKKAFDINGNGCHQFSSTQTEGEIPQNKEIPNKSLVKGGNTFVITGLFMKLSSMCLAGDQGVKKCSNFTHCRIM